MSEKFVKLNDLTETVRLNNRLFTSMLFPPNAIIRAGDLQLRVVSVNDRKDTVTFQLDGIFLKPRTEEDEHVESIDLPQPIILTPDRKIITP